MPLDESWLEQCLASVSRARVTVFGDFCLDAYWLIDEDEGELSVETGLPVRKVRRQTYSLGGAGNVVANLADLGVAEVRAVGLIGGDLFGRQMLKLLAGRGVNTDGLLRSQGDWQTLVYAKPYVGDDEQSRIDFGAFNAVSNASTDTLAQQLDEAAGASDAVILNQQVPSGASTPAMIGRINKVIAAHPDCCFLADSRHRAELYRGAILKLNAHEAGRLVGEGRPLDERITADEARSFAERLRDQTRKPVFVTRGANGILVVDGAGVHDVPGIQIVDRTDPVGAGDTVVAALAAAGLGSFAMSSTVMSNAR